MTPDNAASQLQELHRLIEAAHVELRDARGDVIEALGDYLCGEGRGPTPEQLDALKAAEHRERELQDGLTRFTEAVALRVVEACAHAPGG